MTEPVQIALIVAAGPTALGLCGLGVSLLNRKSIKVVHTTMNSRLDQLLRATEQTAHAKGMSDQRRLDEGKQKRNERNPNAK